LIKNFGSLKSYVLLLTYLLICPDYLSVLPESCCMNTMNINWLNIDYRTVDGNNCQLPLFILKRHISPAAQTAVCKNCALAIFELLTFIDVIWLILD